jgi:signal transduction histidine kinase
LAICKRIIEDHGGTIDARNTPDAGAVITVRLPNVQQQPVPSIGTTIGH